MRLTVLGCAGSFPGPASPASSYLVEHDGFRLLLDMGNGSLGALQRHAPLYGIDAVVISHLHADHCLDLCSYVVARRYAPEGPLPQVPVIAPAGAQQRLSAAYDEGRTGLTDVFSFETLVKGRRELGPFRMVTRRVNHPVETYAVRLETDGGVGATRSLVYSADTGRSKSLVQIASGADAFLCEASFTSDRSNPPNLHLTGRETGDHATRAGVGRLLVTHIPAWVDPDAVMAEVAETFGGDHERVLPGASYEI